MRPKCNASLQHLPQLAANPAATLAAIVDPSTNIRSTLNPDIEQVHTADQIRPRWKTSERPALTRYARAPVCPTVTAGSAIRMPHRCLQTFTQVPNPPH